MYSLYEVAKKLGVSKATLRNWISAGYLEISEYSVSGRHKFDEDYIDSLADKMKNMITLQEAAEIMKVNLCSIKSYIDKGILTDIYKLPQGKLLVSREEVEQLNKDCGICDGNLYSVSDLSKESGLSQIQVINMLVGVEPSRVLPFGYKFYSEEILQKLKRYSLNLHF